jgi:hypothetical protein
MDGIMFNIVESINNVKEMTTRKNVTKEITRGLDIFCQKKKRA